MLNFKNCAVASLAMTAILVTPSAAFSQSPIAMGDGSFASIPPTYKAKTETGGPGFNATAMLTRKLYVDELPALQQGAISVPGRPIPTNDWWTDIINSRFSGALWSYPAELHTSDAGVRIDYPSYWADQGKEIKSRSNLTVGGRNFRADATIASDWHDWDVTFRMPAHNGKGEIRVTSVHGSPFTWFEYKDITPRITLSGDAEIFASGKGCLGLKTGNDLYGIYFPAGASLTLSGNTLDASGYLEWISVALLRTEADLTAFMDYAASIPRSTRVEWSYDEQSARVGTRWTVNADNLRDPDSPAPVLQGFLPHAYKYSLPGYSLSFINGDGYMTPRGEMKLAVSDSGTFTYSYRFSGMLPYYANPAEGDSETNGFSREILDELMREYADKGSFGTDTYWGGKGLVQMALNMTFAAQSGNDELYKQSKTRLREILENWLTYTPGEDSCFFSYYPRWGAMLGFDVSYDSDAFNDHHFHYGYFTYAAALLCMEDRDFAERYGDILTLIAKDYANWDREDTRFPFMRTLDPWCGHSWAGGLGDAGNDNGNGQESTSEAMQGWGGIYLLGVALGNKEMRDAGIWGWNTEARATREYWFDVDSPRPANEGGRKEWPGKNGRNGNYDYTQYPYAYNSNITGKGIGWWTWFGGDPLFMHGIQWMPVSPALDYLSWDKDFAAWAYDDLMRGANSTFSHSWFETTQNSDNGDNIQPLAENDWGNVVLSYLQHTDPDEAARIFDEAYSRGLHIAKSVSTSHISYFVIHSHLTYGDPDFSIHADIPTAQVRTRNGVATYLVYNSDETDRKVNFYNTAGTLVRTVNAPARKLAAISADPVASSIEITVDGNSDGPFMIAPGGKGSVSARVLDQYGAVFESEGSLTVSLEEGAPADFSGNTVTVGKNASKGSSFSLIARCGDLTETIKITVNDAPRAVESQITGIPEICEIGSRFNIAFEITDQYGDKSVPPSTKWSVTPADGAEISPSGTITFLKAGKYSVTAAADNMQAEKTAVTVVTPTMPIISTNARVLASSAENAGTLPSFINDGDNSTRWGSSHTADEWVALDLGGEYFLSRVSLLWETAFGSKYELQVAPAGAPTKKISVTYAGTAHEIEVPVDEAWITAATVSISSPGEKTTQLIADGKYRYVRMRGLERGTDYGYSIHEMKVYGLDAATPSDAIVGIQFNLPKTMDSDETVTLSPTGYTLTGDEVDAGEIVWNADKEALFAKNDFTPTASGLYTVTGTSTAGFSGTASVFVNEVERPADIVLVSDSYTIGAGDEVYIPYTVNNQFLAPYGGDTSSIGISLTDADGYPATTAEYDPEKMTFVAKECGEYLIDFASIASCRVSVLPAGEVNIALNKEAWDSSHENDGLSASFAVDGDLSTRWGSQFHDNEWMTVDLGKPYKLAKAVIYWNNPAYATHYNIETSLSEEEDRFCEIDRREGYVRTDEPVVHTFDAKPARYVRITGLKRSTGYGTSIDEFQLYGTPAEDSTVGIDLTGSEQGQEIETEWYNLQGIRIARPDHNGVCIRKTGSKAIIILR